MIKGESPTLRHVSRTHRVALDWLFDRIHLDPKLGSGMLIPRINSQTFRQKDISHVMKGTTFCVCSMLAFSALKAALKSFLKNALKPWRKDNKVITTKGSSPKRTQ